MIEADGLLQVFRDSGIEFFAGVPDSVLKHFLALLDHQKDIQHVVTANEGAAVALACGYHLASRGLPLVYMQNSGLGNSVNPILSLAGPEIYKIPMVLLIGWRASPGTEDEPQHRQQGRITPKLLGCLDIPHYTLGENYTQQVPQALHQSKDISAPVALMIPYGSLTKGFNQSRNVEPPTGPTLRRLEVLEAVIDLFEADTVFVTTTGLTSRELDHLRTTRGQAGLDFLNVGAMGHANQVALGVAMTAPREVVCLDGDGAVLMHAGNLATIAQSKCANLKHIVFNNRVHESVGGQSVCGPNSNLESLARSFGYRWTGTVRHPDQLRQGLTLLKEEAGPALLEIAISPGSPSSLGRPTKSPLERKFELMQSLAP